MVELSMTRCGRDLRLVVKTGMLPWEHFECLLSDMRIGEDTEMHGVHLIELGEESFVLVAGDHTILYRSLDRKRIVFRGAVMIERDSRGKLLVGAIELSHLADTLGLILEERPQAA